MRNKLMLIMVMVLFSVSLVEAKLYRGTDSNGNPFIVELREISKLEALLRKFFVMFSAVNPNPVMPGDEFEAEFVLFVNCPGGCRPPQNLHYSWEYATDSISVDNAVCDQSYLGTVTQIVPLDTPEGQYTIFGWLSGPLNCMASDEQQIDFAVGENPPNCTGKPCTEWSVCIDGYKTRTCYYDDCSTWSEIESCEVTTIPGSTTIGTTTIGTTTIDDNGDDGGMNIIIILGAVIGLGMLLYGMKEGS